MRRALLSLVLGLAFGSISGALQSPAFAAADPAAQQKWRMLNDYCVKCHNATDWAGSVAFDTMRPEQIAQNGKVWEEAVTKLQGRLMPPPGERQPDQQTIDSFLAWLETHLDAAAQAHPDPGYVTLHRLNRTEYARSVQELLDVAVDAESLLPKDTLSDGFDDIANVLKVSPTFLDQYISAASTVAALAMGNPQAAKSIVTVRATGAGRAAAAHALPLGTHGVVLQHVFPADGDYDFDLGGGGFPGAGGVASRTVLLDGKPVHDTAAGAPAAGTGGGPNPGRRRPQPLRVHVTAGPHDIGIAVVDRSTPESEDWLQPLDPAAGRPGATGLQITGPYNPTGVTDTPSRRKIFSCHPATESEELPCARQIIGNLERVAYRRPINDDDMAGPLQFFIDGRRGATFDAGIENALVAVLTSPKFLFRAERAPQDLTAGASYQVNDLELASRLSFFLWSEGPDDVLLGLATANKLHQPQVLEAQVHRMLADPRASSLVTNFGFQWLKVDDMDRVNPDPAEYPNFDDDLRQAFKKEMELFLGSVLLQDHDVRDLLSANYTFVNGRLALHYGVPDVWVKSSGASRSPTPGAGGCSARLRS